MNTPELYSFPITSQASSLSVGGTAFLAMMKGREFLATVAHALTGHQNFTAAWSEWAPALRIEDGVPSPIPPDLARQAAPIRVMSGSAQQSVPRFWFTRTIHSSSQFVDIVLLPTNRHWKWAEGLPRVQVEKCAPPSLGDRLYLAGYPTDNWPERRTISGPVLSVPDARSGHLTANLLAEPGFSGSPVFTQGGGFVGVCVGHDNNDPTVAQIIPPGPILAAGHAPGGFFHALENADWWGHQAPRNDVFEGAGMNPSRRVI